MNDETHLPKLDESKTQGQQEQAWKKKKQSRTLLPQGRTRAKMVNMSFDFFFSQFEEKNRMLNAEIGD